MGDRVRLGAIPKSLTMANLTSGQVRNKLARVSGVVDGAPMTAAQALLDAVGKTASFTVEPTTPYTLGNLWLDSFGIIRRCTTARVSGAYSASDWTLWMLIADYVSAGVEIDSPVINFTGDASIIGFDASIEGVEQQGLIIKNGDGSAAVTVVKPVVPGSAPSSVQVDTDHFQINANSMAADAPFHLSAMLYPDGRVQLPDNLGLAMYDASGNHVQLQLGYDSSAGRYYFNTSRNGGSFTRMKGMS